MDGKRNHLMHNKKHFKDKKVYFLKITKYFELK